MEGEIVLDEGIRARAPWSATVAAGDILRLIDLRGNQAIDCLMYRAEDPVERYSAHDTFVGQRNVYLTEGTVLRTTEGNALMTITGTTCVRHDSVGGACSKESNTLRYGHHTYHQHACVENFVHEHLHHGLGKRDITSNINWFMNVPVEADGSLGIVDGLSAPGLWVDLRAEMDTLVIISNCPQINNPCNGFDPTPVRAVVRRTT
ncbi:MAG: urea amidolyase associated protein UAAP2 [Actinomycetota bacterium]